MRTIRSIRLLFLATFIAVMSAVSFSQVAVSVSFGPPALPVYEQPVCPGDGYLWTPGYWAYDDDFGDYYWVPGTWVEPPEVGFLWTPGYWGWGGEGFLFHEGYWGPEVGFYGGIAYGFGYFGVGYEGGRWDNGHFFYNRSVNNVNVTVIHNVYNQTVVNNTNVTRVSYNGGEGGITAHATAQEEAAAQQRHVPPVEGQTRQVQAARANPEMRASANQGKPPIAATARPGEFSGRDVVAAKEAGAPYHPPANRAPANRNEAQPAAREANPHPENNAPANRNEAQPAAREANPHPENNAPAAPPVHAKDLPAHERPAPPNTGNPKLDQKYQSQQNKLSAQQEKDHQKLAQQQERDHQQLAKQNADAAKTQQLEHKHQQQTQQMEQKHAQQQQQLQQRQQPASRPAPSPEEKH